MMRALVLLPALYAVGFATHRPSRARVADLLLAVREEGRAASPAVAGRAGDR